MAEVRATAHVPMTRAGGAESVGAPFPHVSGRVVQAMSVRWKGIHGRGADEAVVAGVALGERALEDVHAVLAVRGQLVTPGEPRAVQSAACGVLPLGLVRQSAPGPPAVGVRVQPRDVDDGM